MIATLHVLKFVTAPLRPILAKREPVTLTHVRAAFRATFEEDWWLALRQLRDGAAAFRANAQYCACGEPTCPGVSAAPMVWLMLRHPIANLGCVAAAWAELEPDWTPIVRGTWRQWLVAQFALNLAQASLRPASDETIRPLLGDLARLVMAGERKAPR